MWSTPCFFVSSRSFVLIFCFTLFYHRLLLIFSHLPPSNTVYSPIHSLWELPLICPVWILKFSLCICDDLVIEIYFCFSNKKLKHIFLDFANLFNIMHLPTTMAPWQSGLLYGSAKPWFVGSNPTGALDVSVFLWTKSESYLRQSIPYEKAWTNIQVFFFFPLIFYYILVQMYRQKSLSFFTKMKKNYYYDA